jgi:hypothetical protein
MKLGEQGSFDLLQPLADPLFVVVREHRWIIGQLHGRPLQ